MSGENDSAKDRMEFVIKILDEYEGNIGLPLSFDNKEFEKHLSFDDIKEYLQYSNDELNNLTVVDCSNIVYQLTKFAMQIQRLLNREAQRLKWCDNELNKMLGKTSEQYKPYKWQEKIYCLIHDDNYAEKVNQIKEWAEYRITRLNFMSLSIKDVAACISNQQKVKERQ